MIREINPKQFLDRNRFQRWKSRIYRQYPSWRGPFTTRTIFPALVLFSFDAKELIMKIVELVMNICELLASLISEATAGFIPASVVDEMGILIILILLRAGFDFTKKILEILIVIFAIYVVIQLIPSILTVI